MGVGSKKHKGPVARAREERKGKNQGPKRIGATKPPSGDRALYGVAGRHSLNGKKAKKAAATAAAWALIEGSGKKGKRKHATFSY